MTSVSKCTLCDSPGTNKLTCPLNPEAKKPNPAKHQHALFQEQEDSDDTGYEAYFEGKGGVLDLDTDDWLENKAFIVNLHVEEFEDEEYSGHMIWVDDTQRESFVDYLSDINKKIHNPRHKLANKRYTTPNDLFIEFTFSDDQPQSILIFDPDNNELEYSGEIYVGSQADDLGYRLDKMIEVIKNLPPLK